MPPKPTPASLLPLKPAVFYTLCVLSQEEAHGYRLREEVARRSAGTVDLDPGTYYRLLRRLMADGLIARSTRRDPRDARRRLYRLTGLGRRVVTAEARRTAAVIDALATSPLAATVRPPGADAPAPEFRGLVEHVPDLIWTTDRKGRWTYLNRACQEVYGVDPARLLGESFEARAYPDRAPADRAALASVFGGEPFTDYETIHLDGAGAAKNLSFSAQPIRDAGGRIVGALGTARDVTQRVQTREALVAARAEAERATRSKGFFLANMSHEIRTPLSGVLGMVELLLDTDLTPEQLRSADLIRSSAQSLLRILNDILDFSRIDTGHLELEEVGFDLHELATNTVRVFSAKMTTGDVELTCDIPPNVPRMVRGDPSRLRQVLTNLVSNAVRFTDRGEVSVAVAVQGRRKREADLSFAVRDTGTGIPPDKLEAIFEEYAQADPTVTRTRGGTGLGLAISRRLVRLMGGELAVTSEVGRGSEFRFDVSLRVEEEAEDAAGRYGSVERKRILIVDDNPTSRSIAAHALAAAGAEVSECDSVDAALDAMRRATTGGAPYDIAILDSYMPGRGGFDMAETVRDDADLAHTSLMMLTAAGQRGDGTRARDLGISAYLTKPATNAELLETVAAVLAQPVGAPTGRDLITRHSIRETRRHLKILLAEDNPVNQQVVTAMLSTRGHAVDVVENGRLAVAAVKSGPYDAVLMDVQMPELDGLDATRQIRQTLGMSLPIVAITARVMPNEREECLAAGMNAVVSKPIKPHELFAAVEGWSGSVQGGAPSDRPTATRESGALDEFFDMMEQAGVADMARETLAVYLRDTPQRMEQLRDAVRHSDVVQIEAVSHSLKSASGSIRARRLAVLLGEMEALGRAGTLAGSAELWERIVAEYDAVRAKLRSAVETE